MSRITTEHLSRRAFVYVRQSTQDQLLRNHESRRRQYGLDRRARQLGWSDVTVIDDDLGRSGGGAARPRFERLLVAICAGDVGVVLAVEASRLARNGRDWHTLLEFCGLVGCLLADEDGVYDPRFPNDRLLLGMQGAMSEMELSILRQRSLEALRQKARRGELFLTVAVGYVKVRHDRIDLDPDLRVREAIALVFAKFAAFGSIRQVHLWLRQERIRLPAVETGGDGRRIVWKLPVYNTVRHLLTNPIYGGAYAFGRTESRVTVESGRKRVVRGHRRDRGDWDVLIVEHHEGYISWAEFERNQAVIADNANSKGLMVRGSVRRGDALLAGLLRCGHCGRRLHVSYSGKGGYCVRYNCRGAHINHGTERCISFGGMRVDAAVSTETLRLLAPLGIEAALAAIETGRSDVLETRRHAELALTQARYEADLARRQYDAVRLVLHWQGGDHTRLSVPRNRTGQHRWRTDAETEDLIRALARRQTDGAIAATLNRLGKRTGKGNTWTEVRVRSFRNGHEIAVHRPGEMAERGELKLEEAAERLKVSTMTILRLIDSGAIQADQACKGAPWAIAEDQLPGLASRSVLTNRPATENSNQRTFDFQ